MADAVGTTHQVKLGDDYLLVHPNSYFKRAAPAFGGRFAGGDQDYTLLNFWQHWGQSCWIGGMGQEDWEDDAMYDYGVGVDTSQHDLIALARGLVPAGTGFALGGARRRRFAIYDDVLYCFDHQGSTPAKIYKYTPSLNPNVEEWSAWKTFNSYTMGDIARFAGDMYVGTSGTHLRKYDGGNWKQIKKPKNRNQTPTMMKGYRQRLYVGFGRRLYRLKPNDKWDGNAVFFDGKGINKYVDATFHQGFLYIVSANGHVIRTDGNSTFDLYQFDSNISISSVKSYDGRLFIFTKEWYDDAEIAEMGVYQMSGAAVTEIARYGRVGVTAYSVGAAVVARKMYYGGTSLLGVSDETGFGLVAYDAREDAHSFFAVQRDTATYTDAAADGKSYRVDDVVYFGNRFHTHIRDHGIFRAKFSHRDLDRDIAEFDNTWTGSIAVGNDEGGSIVSSEFDAGTPGLQKIWRKIDVTADLLDASTSVEVGYSLDGGETWVDAGSITKTGSETRYTASFFLEDVKSERFKYKLQLNTSDGDYSPFVRSVVVQFLPNPEPNWVWQFTGVLAEKVELLDGTERTQDVDAIKASLEAAFRNSQLVYFEDVDGTEWVNEGGERAGVLIQDITFSAPYIDAQTPIEYTVQIQLIEAVESYSTAGEASPTSGFSTGFDGGFF